MRAFQLLAPLLLMGVDVADAAGDWRIYPNRIAPGTAFFTRSSCTGQLLWLTFQTDGNLVYYTHNAIGDVSVIWSSDTVAQNSADVDAAVMQTDGNFVIYEKGGVVKWDSGTYPNTNGESNFFTVHDDETLSVGSSSHPKKWTAGISCIPTPAPTAAPTAAPTPVPTPTPVVPGCFEGVLQHFKLPLSNGNEYPICGASCALSGYVYAGIYEGTQCYCGNSLALRQLPDEDCFFRCHDEPCGGPGSSSVIAVPDGSLMFSASKTKED